MTIVRKTEVGYRVSHPESDSSVCLERAENGWWIRVTRDGKSRMFVVEDETGMDVVDFAKNIVREAFE